MASSSPAASIGPSGGQNSLFVLFSSAGPKLVMKILEKVGGISYQLKQLAVHGVYRRIHAFLDRIKRGQWRVPRPTSLLAMLDW